jgi:hypothetical protein
LKVEGIDFVAQDKCRCRLADHEVGRNRGNPLRHAFTTFKRHPNDLNGVSD